MLGVATKEIAYDGRSCVWPESFLYWQWEISGDDISSANGGVSSGRGCGGDVIVTFFRVLCLHVGEGAVVRSGRLQHPSAFLDAVVVSRHICHFTPHGDVGLLLFQSALALLVPRECAI